jgi:poly-beta-1,6-N-acetyl-D-glucosamine synthase
MARYRGGFAGQIPTEANARRMCTTRASRYAIVSACRNESEYIDGLVDSVASQTLKPWRWVIVDDGSTDDTYARAAKRQRDLTFLQVVKSPNDGQRSFASQAYAANFGYQLLRSDEFDFIGFLDADIRLGKDYYERVLAVLCTAPRLGLAGGAVIDHYPGRTENPRLGSEDYHVAGGVQLFRRLTFDQIGGYVPIEGGGQDTIADFMSMMHGWRVQAIPEIRAMHVRPDGASKLSVVQRGLMWGKRFYGIGYHPVFYAAQCMRRVGRRPILLGSLSQLMGFVVASLVAQTRPVPEDFVRFLRAEQMRRLRAILVRRLARGRRRNADLFTTTERTDCGCQRPTAS